jgi:hypothetical protein
MRASYLRLLLVAGMMAPAISLAAGNNPFVPSAPAASASAQLESRIRALEERAMNAEERLRELTMENLPGIPGEMLRGTQAPIEIDESVEVIGIINGKCLVKRTGSGSSKLEEVAANGPCINKQSAPMDPAPTK